MSYSSITCGSTEPTQPNRNVPAWVPEAVTRYLTHTETGMTIREVARQSGCHASTVLRQIRKVETRRDDPLFDCALVALSSQFFRSCTQTPAKETDQMGTFVNDATILEDAEQLDREAFRVLRRLCETGAVLAVAEGMETAVVVREGADHSTTKTASIGAKYVEAMALNTWISCDKLGRISRYKITHAGRCKLEDLIDKAGPNAIDEGPAFAQQHRDMGDKTVHDNGRRRRVRFNMTESPVTALARRRDKDGSLFLNDELVTAAERLREDFELAQMGPRVAQNWDNFLTPSDANANPSNSGLGNGPSAARARVSEALRDLGPGLGDVALRCCCYLEGLETAEKRMGWSARSGKIVLRIALQRLSQYYKTKVGDVLIG
jgi:hypothetical protein